MRQAIKQEVKTASRRMIAKMSAKNKKFEEHRERITKRTGVVAVAASSPTRTNDHFDPYFCVKNANVISKAIWDKIEKGTYQPETARTFDIPKKDGGVRPLMAFSIPDNAVAKLVFRSVVKRNVRVFSPNSYAYMPDRDIFDAIRAIGEINPAEKIFSIQIDFRKFFDQIPHDFLNDLIGSSSNGASPLRITVRERQIIRAFMSHSYSKSIVKKATGLPETIIRQRDIGTPQGSSISLLLANLALHDLDKSLNIKSGDFVRYADDVVAYTNSYEQALQVEKAFYDHANLNNLEINKEKSPGIAVFSDRPHEMKTTEAIDFLGYRFTLSGTTISEVVEQRIKQRISKLINLYLIQYIRNGAFNPGRVSVTKPQFDWDLLGLVSELRRAIYGGNSEKNIKDCLYREQKIAKMYGIMAHYALIDDLSPFKRLDGWMVNTVRRAMKRRATLIASSSTSGLTPSKSEIIQGTWLDMDAWDQRETNSGFEPLPEVRFPSFVKACKAAKIHARNYGVKRKAGEQNSSNEDLSDLLEY